MRVSAATALFVALVSIPLRAPAPLSGDGAEVANNLVHGGVLHPPGFALQAWLQRLLALVPVADVDGTVRVVALCLVAHALAAFFIAETLRVLGVRPIAFVSGALVYALFPTTWALGVEPEVFALAHALIAALSWQCARFFAAPKLGLRHAAELGVVVALAGAQHPITIVYAPMFIGSLAALVRAPLAADAPVYARRAMRVLVAAVAFVVVFGALCFSLPLLHGASVWPDAPVFDSVDVVNHVLRRGYGTFDLGVDVADAPTALGVLADYALRLPELAVVVAAGAVVAVRMRARSMAALLAVTTAACALLFLQRAALPGNATPYLERFLGVFVVAGAVLAGLAVDAALARASAAKRRPSTARALVVVVAAAVVAHVGVVGFAHADLSERNEIDVFRQALGHDVPADAVWFAATDREVLGGAVVHHAMRYPVFPHDIHAWYWSTVVKVIEPRVPWPGTRLLSAADVTALARGHGFAVAATDRGLIDPKNERAHLRGLVWVVDGTDTGDVDNGTVNAAAALCPFVDQLHARPRDAPGFGHTVQLTFARAFDGAATVLSQQGSPRAADAKKVAAALEGGVDEAAWRTGCAVLDPPVP